MQSFKDSQDRDWDLTLNVETARRVLSRLKVNPLHLFGSEAEKILGDEIMLVDVLCVLCEAQRKERNVSDYDFGAAMVGDAIERGAVALAEEVANFSPEKKREILLQVISKGQQAAGMVLEKARKFIETFDPATQISQSFSSSSTSSPAA